MPTKRASVLGWIVVTAIIGTGEPLPAVERPAPAWKWTGKGALRIIVRVDPPADRSRAGDERPADVAIDFEKLLHEVAPGRKPDLAGVQVIRHDPQSGEPVRATRNAFGRGEFDLPCRWYDAAIPYEFPEVEDNVSSTEGKLRYVTRTRLGYFFDCLGDWKAGRLAFAHRVGDAPAWYAMYFDLLPEGAVPRDSPPRGFLGDGLQRCEPQGSSSTGLIHSRVAVSDFDGDGLFDLVVGCSRGGVVWYPNRGQRGKPEFAHAQLVFSDGKPLDVGWGSAPYSADWDGDSLEDLLVGGERNRLLWFRNRGAKGQPRFEYAGLVTTDDGHPLVLPVEPVPEGPEIYKLDYYPVVETIDWDHDGDLDLLAGGFITGRIYLYENLAGAGREPKLRFAGPLESDGKPLDVGWAAAPAAADLDGDGDWDLVSGCMPMTAGGGDSASSEHFLRYFRNDGTAQKPRLHEIAFPRRGQFPNAA
ncbi:MAG TPA: VCBS repeat-containing protein, partial [Pirellulales bacterium]|nr:VCBS repeat-containing protein [Pirellulales bacterium]